jgi:hypothetical protein
MRYCIVILIFACANDLFYLVPDYHIQGVFNVRDLGNFLILISIGVLLFKGKHRKRMINSIGVLIFCYLLMVLVGSVIASINYRQSLFSSLIVARHQLYYLSYFLFILVFQQQKDIENLMSIITIMAIVLIGLSIVNYSGFIIFHHPKWSEGSGIRSGILRAFVPGMDVIGMAFIWQFTRLVTGSGTTKWPALNSVLLFGGLLFRQTRARIIAASVPAAIMIIKKRRLKLLVVIGLVIIAVGLTINAFMPENVLLSVYRTSYTDIDEGEGTWGSRLELMEMSLKTFKEHPLMGSGALLIRLSSGRRVTERLLVDSEQADLGYINWVKNFGVLGAVWMALLVIVFYRKMSLTKEDDKDQMIAQFAGYQFASILVSMVTLGYFFRVPGILILCLTLACVARSSVSRETPLTDNRAHNAVR